MLIWTCLICKDIHPIDHEGLIDPVTGEMICCGCEGKINKFLRKNPGIKIKEAVKQLQEQEKNK